MGEKVINRNSKICFPNDWETINLKDDCFTKVIMGQSPPSSTYNSSGIGLPFLQGKAEFGEVYPKAFLFCSKPIKIAEKDNILLSIRAPVGDVNINPFKVCIGRGLLAIETKKEKLNHFFLFYYLKFIKKYIEILSSGSTFKAITKNDIGKIEIPLPPVNEQKIIIFVLNAIQEAIKYYEEVIGKIKDLKDLIIKRLFIEGTRKEELKETEIGKIPKNWNVVKLEEVTEKIEQRDPSQNPDKEIKYVDISSISNKSFKIVEFKSFYGKGAPSRARKIVKPGDIIFATVRPYLRRIAIIPDSFINEYCSTAFCVIRCNALRLKPYFIFHYIATDRFVQKVSRNQSGSGYPAVTDKDILSQSIPLPPLDEQLEIIEILQTIDQKIDIEQKKKELYGELFRSMLDKLMNGKIRVNNIVFKIC